MDKLFIALCCLIPYITEHNMEILNSKYPWLSLPATPRLPQPIRDYHAYINDISIWYTIYGPDSGIPVLFLHGGFANSDYWGFQIQELKSVYRCILMDSRGQGRSSMSSANITYDLMTTDVVALLDHLEIASTHLIGWSDGAIIGLNLAMNYPERLSSLFAFGANYVYTGGLDVSTSIVFNAYLHRTQIEYEAMNPAPVYTTLVRNLMTMWSTLPNWSHEDFEKIETNLSVWIVDGDHEEVVSREQPDTMFKWIPQAGELILSRTSHFAFLQDPEAFTAAVSKFLNEANYSEFNVSIMLLPSTIMLCHFLLLLYPFF